MDENHIDAETEAKLKELAKADSDEFWAGVETAGIELTKEMLIEAAKKVHGVGYSQRSWDYIERRLKEICEGDSEEELSEAEKAEEDFIRDAEMQAKCDRAAEASAEEWAKERAARVPTATLVYDKLFFGFRLTITKNMKGLLLELRTHVEVSAVFGLCCRFLTGLGVPAAQIGGVEPIFSEWLPFPDAEL